MNDKLLSYRSPIHFMHHKNTILNNISTIFLHYSEFSVILGNLFVYQQSFYNNKTNLLRKKLIVIFTVDFDDTSTPSIADNLN